MPRRKLSSSKQTSTPSRRQMLKAIGTGTLLVAANHVATRHAYAAAPAAPSSTQPSGAPPVLQPFPLANVRLLDGPFLEAEKRNEAYLLKLEADRMLHNFHVNAGLQPKATVYGGWESVQTWAGIRCHGHTLGHYLSAASLMYASTGHEEMKNRMDYIVSELNQCQDAGKTGLICAFPDNSTQIDNMVAGRRAIGVPWYTLHKIFAGLRDAHLLGGNAVARDVLVRLADWAVEVTRNMTDAQFERMLGTEHGGMNEVLADVYALTGKEKYLALAERFCHKAVLTPLSEGRDILNGLHSNTQIPKIVGFERLYQLTGKAPYHAAAEFFWKTVIGTRSFATGGNGDNEHFFPVNQFAQHLSSAKTMETCCSHNMLRLARLLFTKTPTAAYGDYYERTLYNAILGSQDPDTGMMTYFQSTRPGYIKLFCTPFDSFWCCTGSGMENHAKYGDSIYFRGAPDGSQKNALYVNLFIASALDWKEKGVVLTQTTSFPEAGKTRLEVTAASPQQFTLNLRHPAWAATASVAINGVPSETSRQPGSYIAINRTWKTGDVVELDLPMTLRMELLPGTTDTAAVVYGPIVLVGALGHEVKPGEDLHVNERTIGSVLNERIDVPTFAGELATIPEKIKPTGAPLTFKTDGLGRPNDVTLIPYHRLAHQHYNMYWKIQRA
ncbi:MAG: glycoside hydrolase family 127 protein [Planctomycetota bacterium]|nr:glycoside hydrolase family 127 protein [Planctomycetota bacterium]